MGIDKRDGASASSASAIRDGKDHAGVDSEEDILKILKNIVHTVVPNLELPTITLKSRIIQDLGIDSLEKVDLVLEVEERFNIEIKDDEVDSLRTVADVVDYIRKSQQ